MKEIFIERGSGILRIALKENNKLKECFIEEEDTSPKAGEIYKGIVKNIVPAIKCAFIDIGSGKNAYMYLDRKFKNISIKKGDELILEVLKEDIDSKGCKVTNAFSIPGRYIVLSTFDNSITFSQKIKNKTFKEEVVKQINKPKDIGVTIRTNAENISIEKINIELEELYKRYTDIKKRSQYLIKPSKLYGGSIVNKVLRDKLDSKNTLIYCDFEEDFKEVLKEVENSEDVNAEVMFHKEERSLFDYYSIEKELLALRNNRVYLECGGYLVLDKTEAMHVIDVNSGKNTKGNSIESTVFTTNLQAAEEIVRQIRLRNLSGIIVIDFIDMKDIACREKIISKLEEGFVSDKNKTVIHPFTELNLVQIARRRNGRSIYEYIDEECKCCGGKGKRIKFSYLCTLIKNEILKINIARDIIDVHIDINEMYKEELQGDILSFVKKIQALDKRVYVTYSNRELFKVEAMLFINQVHNLENYRIYG